MELNELFANIKGDGLRADFMAMRGEHGPSFDSEAEWVIQAIEKNDYNKKTALANPDAVYAAVRNIAGIGITLDPAQKLAYILPRDNKLVLDVSYMGLLQIAMRSGAIQWAQAHRVYTKDVFKLRGYDAPPVHERDPFASPDDRGDVRGVYVVVKTAQGDYLTNAMAIDDINAIRDRSPSWKKDKSGPWKTDSAEMEKKTVVKNAYKYWPRSEALDKAIHYLNTDGGQGIDLTQADETTTNVKIWTDKVNAATDGPGVAAVWKEARTALKETDIDAYNKVREVVAARNRELGVAPAPAATTAPAPTPAPTATPAPGAGSARAATPPPPAAAPPARQAAPKVLSVEAQILADIDRVPDTDAQKAYDALNAIAERIDALPAGELQNECNDAWNMRLDTIKKKHGHS